MSTFKVGDRVVITGAANPLYSYVVGTVTTVLSGTEPAPGGYYSRGEPVHRVDIKPRWGGKNVWCAPYHLELYRPDGSEKGEWDEFTRKLCGGTVLV